LLSIYVIYESGGYRLTLAGGWAAFSFEQLVDLKCTTTLSLMVPFGMIQRMPIILEIHTPFGIIRNVKGKKAPKKRCLQNPAKKIPRTTIPIQAELGLSGRRRSGRGYEHGIGRQRATHRAEQLPIAGRPRPRATGPSVRTGRAELRDESLADRFWEENVNLSLASNMGLRPTKQAAKIEGGKKDGKSDLAQKN